jgi:tetratricopeptide (TPR) repeat protein
VRRQIAQARIDVGAGRYEQALAGARTAIAEARGLDYDPALAEALLVQGHAQMNLLHRGEAAGALTEAMTLAISSRNEALEVEAWARRAYALGTLTDPNGATAGLDVIEPLAKRARSSTFARALLYNNLGSVELGRDRRAQARDYFERALAESQRDGGPVALELLVIRKNLAFVTDDRARGDQLLVQVTDELAARLGTDHPDTLRARESRGFVMIEDLRKAEEVLTPVCRSYESWSLEDPAAKCWNEVGLVRLDLGDRDGAKRAMASAAHGQVDTSEATAYVTLLQGDARSAARQFANAVAAHPRAPPDPWWRRLWRAQLMIGLGRADRELGDLHEAREVLEATIGALEEITRAHPQASYERRLGRARVELAFTLQSLDARSPALASTAAAGLAWLRRAGGAPDEIRRLEEAARQGAEPH